MSAIPDRRAVTDAEARALASSLRWRILRLCTAEPRCNREIAEALGLNAATALHHVRTLAEAGFLEALPERRGRRGAKEIPYRTTDKLSRVDAGDVTAPIFQAFLEEYVSAPYERRTLARGYLRLTADEMHELTTRLDELLREYDARPEQEGAEGWGILIASHPGPDAGDAAQR